MGDLGPMEGANWFRSREVAAFDQRFGQQMVILSSADAHEK
jgi:hypothetical protein